MPTNDPPPGYNYEFPHLNQPSTLMGPSGPPGMTGATGPPGPMPSEETIKDHVRKQTRFVVLDLLAGADMEWLKPIVREIVREEMKAAMAEFFPERVKKPLRDANGNCNHVHAERTPTHDEDGTWFCFDCHATY